MMGVIRLNADGTETVIVPNTDEEERRGRENILRLARAIARLAAKEDYEAALAAGCAEQSKA